MRQRTMNSTARAERRERDRQRLKQAAEQLLQSEGWRRWVTVRSKNGLARYSLANQLLIALACPHATYIAGFRAWLQLGYRVSKGEKAIWIFAPITLKPRNDTPDTADEERGVVFRAVPVFDRSQVVELDGTTPVSFEPPCQPLAGDSHQHLLTPLTRFAETLGYRVSFEAVEGTAGGWCDKARKLIVVASGQPANARVRILVHELAHALGVDYQRYTRRQAEVIVDTVSYIVCSSAGLDVSGETIPYIAGWGETGALEAVNKYAAIETRFFFGTLNAEAIHLENRLLNLLAFAETYHRRLFNACPLPKATHRRLREQMLGAVDQEHRSVYEPSLSYANSQSQRERVRFLALRAADAIPAVAHLADRLVPQLIDTRNWLMHWSHRTKHVVEGGDLMVATDRLVVILQANLLLDLGLPPASVRHSIGSAWATRPDILGLE